MSQEIYIKEMPRCCKDCHCCSCDTKKEFITRSTSMYCNLLKQGFYWKDYRLKLKDCPLKSLHEYKKELVAKVLEKVRKKVGNISMHTTTKERLIIMCEEIKKEFEDE